MTNCYFYRKYDRRAALNLEFCGQPRVCLDNRWFSVASVIDQRRGRRIIDMGDEGGRRKFPVPSAAT